MYSVSQPGIYANDPMDYRIVGLFGLRHRGPPIDVRRPYICCVGNSGTFGRHVDKPFPELLWERLGVQVLNLGFQHLRLADFLSNGSLFRRAAAALRVVVQFRSDDLTRISLPFSNVVALHFMRQDESPVPGVLNVPYVPIENFYVGPDGHRLAADMLSKRLSC